MGPSKIEDRNGAGLDAAELRLERRRLGMNQSELARALGVSVQTVARWERGPDHSDGRRIAQPRLLALALRGLAAERDVTAEDVAAALERYVGAYAEWQLERTRRFGLVSASAESA